MNILRIAREKFEYWTEKNSIDFYVGRLERGDDFFYKPTKMRKKNPNDATSAVRIIDLSKLEQRQFKNDFALTKNKLIFNLARSLLTYMVGKNARQIQSYLIYFSSKWSRSFIVLAQKEYDNLFH